MSGFFEFLKVGNLLIFLLCILALYYSINLIIYYYAPTATPFINMYFLYYIFFIITLLISVAFNNYIEMCDNSDDDVQKAIVEQPKLEPIKLEKIPGSDVLTGSEGLIGPEGLTGPEGLK